VNRESVEIVCVHYTFAFISINCNWLSCLARLYAWSV